MDFSNLKKKFKRSKSRRSDPSGSQDKSKASTASDNMPMSHPASEHPNAHSAASSISPTAAISSSAQASTLSPQVSTQITSPSPISELWDQAYNDLRVKEEALLKDYEATICGDLNAMIGSTVVLSGSKPGRNDQMQMILQRKIAEVDQNTWKLKFSGNELPVKDLIEPIIGIVDWANEYISGAVSANPYASIAWAGVGLLLPLFLNPSKQAASLAKGLEYISGLIVQSSMRENLYSRRYELNSSSQDHKAFLPSHIGYKGALKELYTRILKFQATSVCYYSKPSAFRHGLDMVKWDRWDSLFEDIQTQEKVFGAINDVWKDTKYEEECEAFKTRHQEAMNTWKSIGRDVSGLLTAIKMTQKNTERRELLNWLSSVDPSSNYNSARSQHETSTGDWLVDGNQDFKHWEHATNSFLWLHGKAGSGKSVLSSSVIKHLRDSYDSDPQTALGFFYITFNDVTKQTTEGMLSSLIKQLCCRRPDTPQPVQSLGRYKEQGQRPDIQTLESTLSATVHGFSEVYLVIDGLDECSFESGERMKLLGALCRIHMVRSENLHLLCTSRKEPDIEAAIRPHLSSPSQIDIDLSIHRDAVDHDIGLYIDKTLASFGWSDSLKSEARAILIENADGMFQYIACQFDNLRKHTLPLLIRKSLKDLPKGLDATYERILLGINPDVEKQVTSLLKWLAFSLRPLRLEELAEAFILDHEYDVPFDKSEAFSKPEDVLQYLPGLVMEVPIHVDNYKEVGDNVDAIEIRLAHFSIKEYLISSRIRESPAKGFSTTETDSHQHLTQSCLAYHLHLSKTELATEKSVKQFALWKYAALQWINHLEMVEQMSWTTVTTSQVSQVLTPNSQSLLNMVRMRGSGFFSHRWDKEPDELASPLYYTSSLGAFQLANWLIEQGADVNAQGGDYGNALQAAAFSGNRGIVQLLLERGADINAQGGDCGNALQAAAFSGNRGIVQLLLERGADINAQGGDCGNALQAAAFSGNRGIVQLLLERGADINAQGENYGTALQAAAFHGKRDIVQLLLERGADINAQGGNYRNALQAAALHGKRDIVQLLLERGADVNAQGGNYGNALQAAALFKKRDIVQLLLERGADVNAQGGDYGTALQAAALYGNRDIVQLLLERGADINAQGENYGTALQAAALYGNRDIVQLLLQKGAKADLSKPQWVKFLAQIEDKSEVTKGVSRLRELQEGST